jgi:ribose transport system substrate-binding protein
VRRWFLRSALCLFGAGLLAVVPACSGGGGNGGPAGKPRVAIVTNCVDPFWDLCQAGAMKAGKDFDVEVIFKQPDPGTVDKQMKEINDVVLLGLNGLAVSVNNPKEQTPKLKGIAADLPKQNFLTIDNDAPDTGRLAYIGVDNVLAGKEVGRLVKQARPDGGTLALFIGTTDSDNSKKRVAGVLSELAGEDVLAEVTAGKYRETYGKFKLHKKEPITDGLAVDKAAANSADAMAQLQGTPNLVFVGLYAYNPAKILEAARAKGLVGTIKIVGFDEDTVTLDGIEKGEIEGSVSQDPYNYGYETVKWLSHVARDKDKKDLPQKATAHSIITKDGGTPVEHDGLTVRFRKASEYKKLIADATKK